MQTESSTFHDGMTKTLKILKAIKINTGLAKTTNNKSDDMHSASLFMIIRDLCNLSYV